MIHKERLRLLLEWRDWSHNMLALRSGVARSNISSFLSIADRDIAFSSMVAIADAFGVSLNWFAGRPDPEAAVLAPDEAELLRLYRTIADPKLRQVALNGVRLQSEYGRLQDE